MVSKQPGAGAPFPFFSGVILNPQRFSPCPFPDLYTKQLSLTSTFQDNRNRQAKALNLWVTLPPDLPPPVPVPLSWTQCLCPPNRSVKALTLSVVVSGGGTLGAHEGRIR